MSSVASATVSTMASARVSGRALDSRDGVGESVGEYVGVNNGVGVFAMFCNGWVGVVHCKGANRMEGIPRRQQ